MKKRQVVTLIVGATLLFGVAVVGYIGYQIVNDVTEIVFSDNESDNNSPEARKEMARVSCEWGRLADFPASKRHYAIQTEGGSFSRSFRGSFSDSPATIQKWLSDSPGVHEGKKEVLPDSSTQHTLKMGGGATYGEVIVSEDMKDVTFYITWS